MPEHSSEAQFLASNQ